MKQVVNVADMKVSADPRDTLVTYALGSCLGITVYDPLARVGGMLHVMLPLSTINPDKASSSPYTFVDTGVPELFMAVYRHGAMKDRLIVKVAGGACSGGSEEDDHFQIGKRNVVIFRKLLWKNSVMLEAEDVGGSHSRTMSLDLGTGLVTLKMNGSNKTL